MGSHFISLSIAVTNMGKGVHFMIILYSFKCVYLLIKDYAYRWN